MRITYQIFLNDEVCKDKKFGNKYFVNSNDVAAAYDKLGVIEDLLEKYKVKDIISLEKILSLDYEQRKLIEEEIIEEPKGGNK